MARRKNAITLETMVPDIKFDCWNHCSYQVYLFLQESLIRINEKSKIPLESVYKLTLAKIY